MRLPGISAPGYSIPKCGAPGRGVSSRNLLVDGNMEAATTAAWTAAAAAVLTKETTTPHGGARCLRVAYGGTNLPRATQAFGGVAGKVYRLTGWARSDGVVGPRVYDSGSVTLWTGTASTSWQYFSVTYTAVGTSITLMALATGAGYVEFDDLSIVKVGG